MSQQNNPAPHKRSPQHAMYSELPGALITLEGIDGSGKTALLNRLAEQLTNDGYNVITTKEPGGTNIGRMLKRVLLEEEKECNPRVEYLLFAADRAEHFARLVIPALRDGAIVISDRMADSALAYQGYGRGLSKELITTVNSWAMHDIVPDITFYLKISPEICAVRRAQRSHSTDTMEREKRPFWNAVSEGYDKIAQTRDGIKTIDATQTKDEVFQAALAHIRTLLTMKPDIACEHAPQPLPH